MALILCSPILHRIWDKEIKCAVYSQLLHTPEKLDVQTLPYMNVYIYLVSDNVHRMCVVED